MRLSALVVFFALTAAASQASAAVAVGGSSLLTGSDANQLQNWLNEGDITITKVFSKEVGDGQTSADFHAAVDGKGRTFVLIEVLGGAYQQYSMNPSANGSFIIPTQVIGGYNPQSWSSSGTYNITSDLEDRTAFIFNLTFPRIQEQSETLTDGEKQTYNHETYGPTFGGYDIYVDQALTSGYVRSASYGEAFMGPNIVQSSVPGGFINTINGGFGRIEVFTIEATATTPEPATMVIWGLGMAGVGIAGLRRRNKAKTAA